MSNQETSEDTSIRVTTSDLPDGSRSQMIFQESGFFKQMANGERAELPSPAEVRLRVKNPVHPYRPPPIAFESLHLLVKYGTTLTTSEAQCLWAVGKYLKGRVPVPEVYGWRRDGKELFIYMELILGETLKHRWSSLTEDQRENVCTQLRSMVHSLRMLKQHPNQRFIGTSPATDLFQTCLIFIGSFGGGSSTDISFEYCPSNGQFPSCKAFLDWFSTLYLQKIPKHPNSRPDPYRKDLPDNVGITFTHNDLHPGNIIVSGDGPPKICAIVDWHQSGWYPEYWEYCKAQYTADPESEWSTKYIPSFLTPCDEKVSFAWEFYQAAKGY